MSTPRTLRDIEGLVWMLHACGYTVQLWRVKTYTKPNRETLFVIPLSLS